MWNGKKKAVTFSYDDGVVFDKKLVEILNRYNMKCTFNLNSGIQTYADSFKIEEKEVHRMNVKGLKELYRGHEIASHTLTHPNLVELDEETIYNEISRDIYNLENTFDCKVKGMAYPYGTYDDKTVKIAEELGIKYARTVWDNGEFGVQTDLMRFRPTCRHEDTNLMQLAEDFLNSDSEEPQLFYIWGHSYEFYVHDNWKVMEKLCEMLSSRDDVFYGTNSEVFGV